MGIDIDKNIKNFIRGKLNLDLIQESKINIQNVLRARLWLGAVILGTHSGILSYRKFGGTELDLVHGNLKNNWKEVLYLETAQEVIKILKNNRESDSKHNRRWIERVFVK